MIDFKQKMEETEKQERGDWEEVEALAANKKRNRIIVYIIIALVVGIVFAGRIIMSSPNAMSWLPGGSFFSTLKHLVPGGDRQLQGEDNDRVNILLSGMGGEGHDGPYLTDTILLLSIKPSTKQVSMISVPRDLVAPVSNWQKINSVNAYAEQKSPGSGGAATAQAISDLFQVPIQYYIRADFDGFVRIVDELGGVQVNVENTLDDYSYPIDGQESNPNYYARYEHLHIDKGLQAMNGALALKYARSRHAMGREGSDFARARRQQLLMEAIKNKLLSEQTLLNPIMMGKLVSEFSNDISTNLSVWEMIRLWSLTKDINRDQIINKVLSDAPDGFLVSGTGEDGAYILTPRTGNFAAIRNLAQNIFTLGLSTEEKIETIKDSASVIVTNGTFIAGLANRISAVLTGYKFVVPQFGNAPQRNYAQTVVYDLTNGQKSASLSVLEKTIGAKQDFSPPDWLKTYPTDPTKQPDFFLILGTDADKAEN